MSPLKFTTSPLKFLLLFICLRLSVWDWRMYHRVYHWRQLFLPVSAAIDFFVFLHLETCDTPPPPCKLAGVVIMHILATILSRFFQRSTSAWRGVLRKECSRAEKEATQSQIMGTSWKLGFCLKGLSLETSRQLSSLRPKHSLSY